MGKPYTEYNKTLNITKKYYSKATYGIVAWGFSNKTFFHRY